MQSFHLGDSARADDRSVWQRFFARLEGCAALEAPWTLVLQDPLGNSFVSSVVDDPRNDPRMSIEARTLLMMLLSKCRHSVLCTNALSLISNQGSTFYFQSVAWMGKTSMGKILLFLCCACVS